MKEIRAEIITALLMSMLPLFLFVLVCLHDSAQPPYNDLQPAVAHVINSN